MLDKLNSPIVVAVALVFFVALDGFLLYRYQQASPSPEDGAATVSVEEPPPPPPEEITAAVEEAPPPPREETTTAEEPPPPPQEEGEPTTPGGTSASPQEESGVRVVVSVVGAGGAGLSVLEDGQPVYDQATTPGFSEEFEAAEAVTVAANDAGAVLVGVGGEDPEPLGASGEGATRTFTA